MPGCTLGAEGNASLGTAADAEADSAGSEEGGIPGGGAGGTAGTSAGGAGLGGGGAANGGTGGSTPEEGGLEAEAEAEAAAEAEVEAEADSPQDTDSHPCKAEECFLEGACVEAGMPDPTDPCRVCLPTLALNSWVQDSTNTTCLDTPYWTGWSRSLPLTPYGHATPIACHNCYVDSGTTPLAATLSKIHQAQAGGADLIELDLCQEGGAVRVEHNDDGNATGALLSEVLADSALAAGDQVLFIEIKETAPNEAFMQEILQLLAAGGYPKPGRPVVLRAFDGVSENLEIARHLLATPAFLSLRPYVRLHVLAAKGDGSDVTVLQQRVTSARARGFHGVEFEYTTANLFAGVAYARSARLGTSIYTIPSTMGEIYVAVLRDEVDSIACDYAVTNARQVVQDNNGLLYLNAFNQNAAGTTLQWFRTNATPFTTTLGVAGMPTFESLGLGENTFGTSLVFAAAQQQSIAFWDADNDPNAGYLVATVVNFDQPIPAEGDASVLVGKADSGAFTLELSNPNGQGASNAVLRYGVYVDGAYRYATYPAQQLSETVSYLITGAYDGEGSVWLFVNNSSTGTTQQGPYSAGVVQNDSTLRLGADPQGPGAPRFYFSGRIQMALVQKWAGH